MSIDDEGIGPPSLYTKRTILWMLMTFVLTPFTAGLLAQMEYIPFTVEMAMLNGLIVAFVYVGFRVWKVKSATNQIRTATSV